MLIGTAFLMNFMPWFYMYYPILFEICWSKPLKRIDLTIIVTSVPKACKNPPHSRAIYDAPTTKVFPGFFLSQKISSDEIECSFPPGMPGSAGLPPVAIRIYLALTT